MILGRAESKSSLKTLERISSVLHVRIILRDYFMKIASLAFHVAQAICLGWGFG